jgi:hypothetical protein
MLLVEQRLQEKACTLQEIIFFGLCGVVCLCDRSTAIGNSLAAFFS